MPLTWRHPAGMLAAALAPALVTGCYVALTGSPGLFLLFFVAAFIVAGLHVGLLAMPIFAILSRIWRPRLWNVAPAAFLIGSIPFLMFAVRGVGTWAEWVFALETAAIAGALGLSGGLAFWLVLNLPGSGGADPA